MAFNADHHKEPAATQQKGHEHGTSHEHDNSSDHHQNPASHHENPADHHQDQADHHDKQASHSEEKTADDCCKDEVAKFEKNDKRTPQPFNYNIQPQFVNLAFNTPYNIDVIASYLHLPSNKYFVRNHHPPIADTRIAIQSFLI